MAHGAPDWTRQVQVVLVAAQPTDERAAGGIGRYSGTDQTYQTMEEWTVATGYRGELKEILPLSSDYTKTEWKVVIDAVTYCEDTIMLSSMPLIFEDLRLAAAAVVTVSARSTDGTSITCDAAIVAKEVVV